MVANNIVRPQTKNRGAGIWEPNPLPRRVGAQEDGRISPPSRARATACERSRSSPRGIAAVDFPVIYGNIAALFAMSDADLRTRIKEMMVKNLMLQITADQIADDAPLFGPNGIGLDSIDALELAVGLEKNFGVSVPNSEIATKVLRNVNTIHDYILEKRGESAQSQTSS
jgi:acyl carrier protein